MKKISVFNHVTVDGFFAGPNGEIDWFKEIKKMMSGKSIPVGRRNQAGVR